MSSKEFVNLFVFSIIKPIRKNANDNKGNRYTYNHENQEVCKGVPDFQAPSNQIHHFLFPPDRYIIPYAMEVVND